MGALARAAARSAARRGVEGGASVLCLGVVAGTRGCVSAAVAAAEGDAKRGAMVYRACVSCHSLEPNMHLTGPSLADLWGKRAGSQGDFPRYSKALKSQDFVWNETTLNAWIANPAAFVKDNYMSFRGINDDKARGDLIAFLRVALASGGAKAVVEKGLLAKDTARGQAPEPLDDVGPAQQVKAMRYCQNSFFVTTADGQEHAFWALNLRLKVDAGPTGPKGGKPVLMQSGMQGDRASLVFSDPAHISAFVQGKC
jgi:cytochrome c